MYLGLPALLDINVLRAASPWDLLVLRAGCLGDLGTFMSPGLPAPVARARRFRCDPVVPA